MVAVRCDVSDPAQVEALAERAWAHFGGVHLLFNNAGVSAAGPTWTATLHDWQWVLGINLMGVVHGIRSFVPRMLRQGEVAHVVNTASAAGHLSVPGSSVYCVSKHATVTISECLHHELRAANAPIGVSVLCPAFVPTGIADSARNRPAAFADTNPLAERYEAWARRAVEKGKLTAAEVARITLDAVKAGTFYIFTHPHTRAAIEVRMHDILEARIPTNPVPPKSSGETL
jgi:NAD(P)-dependent dehydrogenase (short-subunit alcohol dehydrogenase family)